MKSLATEQPAVSWRAEAALLFLALTWGTSHVVTKSILAEHAPFFYTTWRFGVAALCFGLLFARHLRQSSWVEIRRGAALGCCSFAGIAFYSLGLTLTNASKAGFITGLYLVFTPLVALALFRTRPTRDNLAGLLIALVGFALLSYPQGGAVFNWGDALILLAALSWAAHIAATSAFASRGSTRTLAAVQVMTVAAAAAVCHFLLKLLAQVAAPESILQRLALLEARPNPLDWAFAVQLGYMALVVTLVAALVQTWAQARVPSVHAALFYALEPVTAAVFAYLVFGEKLTWRGFSGAALIVGGVLVSRLGLLAKLKQAEQRSREPQTKAAEAES